MSNVVETHTDIVPRLEAAAERVQKAHKAAAAVIFGQDEVIERTLITILSGGHALLIGVPGLAKTLLVETLGKVLGLDFGSYLTGSILTETIFSWPGVGRYVLTAIDKRDLPAIQGSILFLSLVFVIVNLLTDLLYARVDPRVAYD